MEIPGRQCHVLASCDAPVGVTQFLEPGVQSTLDVVRRARHSGVVDVAEQVGCRVAEQRTDGSQPPVGVPPAPAVPENALPEEAAVAHLPRLEPSEPFVAVVSRADEQERRNQAAYLPTGLGLRVPGEPCHGLAVHVNDAALDARRRPDRADGLQQALPAVADHEFGVGLALREREQERQPGAQAFARSEAPADRPRCRGVAREERDRQPLDHARGVEDDHPRDDAPRRLGPRRPARREPAPERLW